MTYSREVIREYLEEHYRHIAQENWLMAHAPARDFAEMIEQLLSEMNGLKGQVLDTAAAAHYTGLAAATIRGAIFRGELPAWKPDGSKVWLMFREDVDAWRNARRTYTRE